MTTILPLTPPAEVGSDAAEYEAERLAAKGRAQRTLHDFLHCAPAAKRLTYDQRLQPMRDLTALLLNRHDPSVEDRLYLMGLSHGEAASEPALHQLLTSPGITVKSVILGVGKFAAAGRHVELKNPEQWLVGSASGPVLDSISQRLRNARVGRWLPWSKGCVWDSWGGTASDLVSAEADETVAEALAALWSTCEAQVSRHAALVKKIAWKNEAVRAGNPSQLPIQSGS